MVIRVYGQNDFHSFPISPSIDIAVIMFKILWKEYEEYAGMVPLLKLLVSYFPFVVYIKVLLVK